MIEKEKRDNDRKRISVLTEEEEADQSVMDFHVHVAFSEALMV